MTAAAAAFATAVAAAAFAAVLLLLLCCFFLGALSSWLIYHSIGASLVACINKEDFIYETRTTTITATHPPTHSSLTTATNLLPS